MTDTIAGVPRDRLSRFRSVEEARYAKGRPWSKGAHRVAAGVFVNAVPLHWMTDWPLPFPMVVEKAEGATLTDLDGFVVDDFCLGDTGSMFGHSPAPLAKAIRRQARKGLTYMLPSAAAPFAGRLLCDMFGDFRWQVAVTATDANRFALRVARAVTGKPKVLVFNGCYHGTVDDAMVMLDGGRTVTRPGLLGQVEDLSLVATCIEFNDIAGVEAALSTGEIAAVLAEPVMTNSCMVLPQDGFHAALRDACTRHGALLIIDETHTISSGHGGYTRVHGLDPDMFVVGKCVAGGVPTAVWGMRPVIEARYLLANEDRPSGHSGMGTTLSANPMQFACLVATLQQVMTPKAYARMEKGAARLAKGLSAVIAKHQAPWHVVRVGARVEFICAPGPLRNGSDAAAAHMPDIEGAMNLALLNRGCLIAPFHNMMLVSSVTKKRQIDRLIAAFDEVLAELFQ
jgi:glutamate-1-semialdehyde 2,1-aminomutase